MDEKALHINSAYESSDLTRSQQLIWTGQLFNPNDALYNMILTFEIKGAVDVFCFKKSFQTLVARHDVLRLVIDAEGELPKQFFYNEIENPIEFIDLSNAINPRNEYQLWVDKNKGKLFEAKKLLYQCILFKIEEGVFIWYINQHHLITDGWSIELLYKELIEIYELEVNNKNSIKEHELSYLNHARLNPFTKEEAHSDYWLKKAESTVSTPSLYGVKQKNSSSNSTKVSVNLGIERTAKLKEFALDSDIRAWTVDLALFNVFLTVMNALIYKIGNQEKFVVGIPSHNRTSPANKNTAGLFMELLPIYAAVQPEDTLLSLFQKTREEAYEVIKNATISKPPSELLKSFNTVINFVPISFSDFAGMPINCEWLHSGHSDPGHNIRLQIQDFNDDNNYKLQFDLNDEVFQGLQKETVAQHFVKLIDAFIDDKEQKLADISLTTSQELALVEEWNNTYIACPERETLLSKFEKQVVLTPENIALIFQANRITYKELNEKSNQLANLLIKKGVKPNDLIAISLERSIELMIGIYGILKAGAAYLPLDSKTPNDRLKMILNDAEPIFLVVDKEPKENKNYHTSILNINDLCDKMGLESKIKPKLIITPDDLAYVIYTSGSTGVPKGVKCIHKGICNRLDWIQRKNPLSEVDVMLHKTPITFDVSLPELFWPLQVGAKLAIEVPEGHKDTDQLIESIRKYNITTIHFVPSMLNLFLEHPEVSNCKSITQMLCSGEALLPSIVDKFHLKLECDLYNLYGPTEASVEVSYWKCNRNEKNNIIPIGFPVQNTQLYILDKYLQMVPIGVSGELYIGGNQLSSGYLKKSDLTKDCFIENPFSLNKKDKMYKTGDQVRYRNDGAIEYLGRLDQQVKLKGFRIELEEIENSINEHQGILQSVVVLNEDLNNSQYLVAYYQGNKIEVECFNVMLKKILPTYMIPSFFVHVDGFELTSSGKIDRKKIPTHDRSRIKKTKKYLAPRNQLEEIIVDVWKNVFQLDQIGIDDNFIQLGGDSLKAIILTSRIKSALELDVTVNLVFIHPNVALYAECVEKMMLTILKEEN
jgi:amino acid adenylation domain-containing protein